MRKLLCTALMLTLLSGCGESLEDRIEQAEANADDAMGEVASLSSKVAELEASIQAMSSPEDAEALRVQVQAIEADLAVMQGHMMEMNSDMATRP